MATDDHFSSGRNIGSWLAAISTLFTVILTGLNAYWSHNINEFESGLKNKEASLKEQQVQLEGKRDRIARYKFVYTLLEGVINQNVAQKTLTVNLITLALEKDEAQQLFAGLQASEDPQARDVGRLGSSISLEGAKVLWVDDNPNGNSYERSLLEQLGVQFVLASSTREAVPLLRGQRFQLVITDFARADDKSAAYTLLGEVKMIEDAPPVIIYSSSANHDFIEEAKKRGAFAETNNRQELFNKAIDAIRKSR